MSYVTTASNISTKMLHQNLRQLGLIVDGLLYLPATNALTVYGTFSSGEEAIIDDQIANNIDNNILYVSKKEEMLQIFEQSKSYGFVPYIKRNVGYFDSEAHLYILKTLFTTVDKIKIKFYGRLDNLTSEDTIWSSNDPIKFKFYNESGSLKVEGLGYTDEIVSHTVFVEDEVFLLEFEYDKNEANSDYVKLWKDGSQLSVNQPSTQPSISIDELYIASDLTVSGTKWTGLLWDFELYGDDVLIADIAISEGYLVPEDKISLDEFTVTDSNNLLWSEKNTFDSSLDVFTRFPFRKINQIEYTSIARFEQVPATIDGVNGRCDFVNVIEAELFADQATHVHSELSAAYGEKLDAIEIATIPQLDNIDFFDDEYEINTFFTLGSTGIAYPLRIWSINGKSEESRRGDFEHFSFPNQGIVVIQLEMFDSSNVSQYQNSWIIKINKETI